ncbi:MAG: alpha/beta hydrolase, partial [Proteobacteria bacterium]|nr:alpha/beta hydrolase [Pseudomonadota bacterium]
EAARFIVALLDAAGVRRAALVGHSFGSLIALEAAASTPDRVSQLALVGTAFPMKVSPALLDASLHEPMKAIDMVNVFSHSTLAPPPSSLGPGTWLYGGSRALMRRVLASNREHNLFHTGFSACDAYKAGEMQMGRVQCATLFIVGRFDQMTPPKAAAALAAKARNAKVVQLPAGHALMTEAPDGVLFALRDFLRAA